jgi:hypothetical protein
MQLVRYLHAFNFCLFDEYEANLYFFSLPIILGRDRGSTFGYKAISSDYWGLFERIKMPMPLVFLF